MALYCNNNPLEYVPFFKERLSFIVVPSFLAAEHSEENYQEGYQLQETNRYFFLMIFAELGLQLDFLG